MIIFSSIKLEHKLAENMLSSWEKAKYIVIVVVLNSSIIPIYIITPSFGTKPPLLNGLLSLFSSALTIYLTYKGIKKCHTINNETDDIDFIGRFATLYVPMTIKFTLVWLPIFLLGVYIGHALTENAESRRNALLYWLNLTGPVLTYLFYFYLSRSFVRLSLLVKKENV